MKLAKRIGTKVSEGIENNQPELFGRLDGEQRPI